MKTIGFLIVMLSLFTLTAAHGEPLPNPLPNPLQALEVEPCPDCFGVFGYNTGEDCSKITYVNKYEGNRTVISAFPLQGMGYANFAEYKYRYYVKKDDSSGSLNVEIECSPPIAGNISVSLRANYNFKDNFGPKVIDYIDIINKKFGNSNIYAENDNVTNIFILDKNYQKYDFYSKKETSSEANDVFYKMVPEQYLYIDNEITFGKRNMHVAKMYDKGFGRTLEIILYRCKNDNEHVCSVSANINDYVIYNKVIDRVRNVSAYWNRKYIDFLKEAQSEIEKNRASPKL